MKAATKERDPIHRQEAWQAHEWRKRGKLCIVTDDQNARPAPRPVPETDRHWRPQELKW